MDGGTATSRNEVQVIETLREEFFPTGILSESAARELIAQYAPHGRVATAGGIETLLRVIEAAIQSPSLLPAFLIGQLCAAVIAGEGPAFGRRPHFSRAIDAEDVRFVRRVLEAAAGAAGMPVSRAEAEALFDLHDAAAAGGCDASFHDLFCKAIANHLIAASSHAVPPRREALAAERDLVWVAIGAEQEAWLASHIMRDGRPTAAELRLLGLLGQSPDALDPSVRRLLDFAA